MSWSSDSGRQGSVGGVVGEGQGMDNGCGPKGTCGLPWSYVGLGGGWQICLNATVSSGH